MNKKIISIAIIDYATAFIKDHIEYKSLSKYLVDIKYENGTSSRTNKTESEILDLLHYIGYYSSNDRPDKGRTYTKERNIIKIIVEPDKCYGDECSCNTFEDNDHYSYSITLIHDDGSLVLLVKSGHYINDLLDLIGQNYKYGNYEFSKKEFRKITKDVTKIEDSSPLNKFLISPYCCNLLSTCRHQVICINNDTLGHYNLSVKEINEMLIEKKCNLFMHHSQYHLTALEKGYFLEFYPTSNTRKIKEIKTIKECSSQRQIEKYSYYDKKGIKEIKEFASQKHVKIIYSDGTTEEDIIEEEINEKVEPANKKIKTQ